jgi:hypothetical protein
MQSFGTHVSTTEAAFPARSVRRLYSENKASSPVDTTGNFPRRTPVRNLHMAFKIPYVYDYIKNYAGNKQKSSYNIMIMKMFTIWDKAKTNIESIRDLNLVAVNHTTIQMTIPLL